ncbi:MAG: AmmeMemoRadiSam system protein B, partial [Candidatus Heimdallarchaeota archaeon]|nr:AmmeMemoRadiSam system protein B [Candidatus Heimdallarchaeota archaeon]
MAGLFYEGSKEGLVQQLAQCFQEAEKKIQPSSTKNEHCIGVIVPHAGLPYSGAIAAYSYKTLADTGFADAFIILGPNHQGLGAGVALYPKGDWETPLGTIPIDEPLVESLAGDVIQLDEYAHQHQENSIEVQLPFLQYFNKPFSIAPIAMAQQDYHTATQ